MLNTQKTYTPAICFLASLLILYGWNLSSADESKQDTSFRNLSELFSSHSLTEGSTSTTTKRDQTLTLSSEQLKSLFDHIDPQESRQETRNNHLNSRRKLLYELSIKAHYSKLARNADAENSTVTPKTNNTPINCIYYNEGLGSIPLNDIKSSGADTDKVLLSRFSQWTFKICPQESIQQIHLVPMQMAGHNTTIPIDGFAHDLWMEKHMDMPKLPPNSILDETIHFIQSTPPVDLGTYGGVMDTPEYFSKVKKLWSQNEQDEYESSTEYYFDGSNCQYKPEGFETVMSKARRSKIVYNDQCCKRKDMAIDQFFEQDDKFMVLSVTEPLPCQYAINVCRFCSHHEAKQIKDTTSQNYIEGSLATIDQTDFTHLMQTYLHHLSELETSTFGRSDHYNPPGAFPPMPPSIIEANKELLRKMFSHAYDSYMYNAFPASELQPKTCTGGTFNLVRLPALTLIDTLDTLIVMRNYTEFARSTERIRYLDSKMRREYKHNRKDRKDEMGGLFSINQNVSLFETTIRVLGGLLSAHQLALVFMNGVVPMSEVLDTSGEVLWGYNTDNDSDGRIMNKRKIDADLFDDNILSLSRSPPCMPRKQPNNFTSPDNSCWIYDGMFLELAHDIGKRLVYAFDTDTGIPFGTVNLLHGVPVGETEIASLAGAGTLTLEFELLSRLTGDPSFGKAAMRATRSLWLKRSRVSDLFGKHINVRSGVWTEMLSGIGSNSDSFYEYLIKHYVLFPDDDNFWTMFVAAYAGVWKNSRLGDWYVDVDMNKGIHGNVKQTFESLMAFYPGMQILIGELSPAAKTLSSFFLVREFLGLLPERFDFVHWRAENSGDVHPLRPELIESAYFLHLASIGLYGPNNGPCSDNLTSRYTSSWLWAADFALHAIVRLSWVPCGFATVLKVGPKTTGRLDVVAGLTDVPELEQTKFNLKHHNEMPSFFLSETIKYLYLLFDSEDNILHQDRDNEWIFTTEAHPIHHVPVSSSYSKQVDLNFTSGSYVASNECSNLEVQMENVRMLLKTQLSNRTAFYHDNFIIGKCLLDYQRKIPQNILDELESTENITIASKNSSLDSFGLKIGPSFDIELHQGSSKQYGIYSSEVSSINFAHHYLHRSGRGINIGKKCPNLHHPRLTWTLALHGHTIDYNTAHKSSSSDYAGNFKVDPRMQTALASVLYYGTDYYSDGISINLDKVCAPHQSDNTKNPVNEKENDKMQEISSIPGATRYDMGGVLGMFDVSAFTTDGFIVRHVDSNELLEVSMFSNEIVSGNMIVLASLTTPSEKKVSDFISAKKKNLISHFSTQRFLKKTNPSIEVNQDENSPSIEYKLSEKRVVVADMKGHSYSCEINVFENDRFLARLPCSPGFFGKAHIENLVQNNGMTVSGQLQRPSKFDPMGCENPKQDNEVNTNNFCLHSDQAHRVQIVHRGECSFTEKTLNQHIERQAAAVIVVNTNPMELFCMAGEKEAKISEYGCSQNDLPPSVLVTGDDGDWLLDLFDFEYVDKSTIMVNISSQKNEELNDFPHVKGFENTLQVIARNGWGVQAVQHVATDDSSNTGWQLYITTHNT